MSQAGLFDAKRGEELREEAIERAEKHADPDFLEFAYLCVIQLARERETFTTDDVWTLLIATGGTFPREPRAMGPVMKRAEFEKLIRATDHHVLSKRPSCHRRPLRVWASLTYRIKVE